MRKIAFVAALLALSILTSCRSLKFMYTNIVDSVEQDLVDDPKQGARPGEQKILYIMLDGLQPDLLAEMLDKGELPNIKKYLYDRGAVARPALSTTPSITYTAMTTMLTGRYPGHTGVPGMYWYDRKTLENRHYPRYADLFKVNDDVRCPILFDKIKDDYSVVIFWPLYRNADRYVRMFYLSLRAVTFGMWPEHDMECIRNVTAIYGKSREIGLYPRFTLLYCISPDVLAHQYGCESPEYRANLTFLDGHLGEMFADLERNGELDKMLVVFATDHGMNQNRHRPHFDLVNAITRDTGLNVQHGSISRGFDMKQRIAHYNAYHALAAISGRRYAFIYLNNEMPDATCERNLFAEVVPYERIRDYPIREGVKRDLIPFMTRYPSVHCALVRKTAGSVAVFCDGGEALIERRIAEGIKTYRYTVVNGKDPFEYTGDKKAGALLDGKFHGSREWMRATAHAHYPDAVVPNMELFDDRERVGDIVLFAADNCDLMPGQKAGHGGLDAEDMIAQMVFLGEGIRHCEFGPVRMIDLMPSMMEYLGEDPGEVDGISFFKEISKR